MKRSMTAIIVFIVLSSCFSVLSHAIIQSPPKAENISAYVYKTEKNVTLDGVIGEHEYKKTDIPQSYLSYIVGSESDWMRVKNLEFEAYASVSSGRFNFALSVKTDEYYNTDCEPKYMWAQTALLLSFAKSTATGRNALEIGIRPDGKYYVWNYYKDALYSPENDFIAVHKNGYIVYEISVPLSAFCAEEDDDFKFCFSISCGDYFNGERQAYVQFGQGISGFSESSDADAGKNAAIFPTVHILSTGEKAPEPDSNVNPPDTGLDLRPVIVVSVSLMAVSLLSIRILKLKIFIY